MNLSPEEKKAKIEEYTTSKETFFVKEDSKDVKSSDDEDEEKDKNAEPEDSSQRTGGNIFAALAALQTGQMSLSQVRNLFDVSTLSYEKQADFKHSIASISFNDYDMSRELCLKRPTASSHLSIKCLFLLLSRLDPYLSTKAVTSSPIHTFSQLYSS